MPQMAPMSWLILFIFFTASLMLFNMMNYYLYTPKIESTKASSTSKVQPQSWKW